MATNKTEINGGIGFFGLLTIAFIVLKLCNVITWSWFWVLSPIIISLIIFFISLLIFITIFEYELRKRTI